MKKLFDKIDESKCDENQKGSYKSILECFKNAKPMLEKILEVQDKWLKIKDFFLSEENQKNHEADFKKFTDTDRRWFQ